jgi:F-type H+-transporting ATPase subunit a
VATDPIHQFQIHPIVPIEIGGVDFSFTNSALFMVLSVVVGAGFLMWATMRRRLVPSRAQAGAEMFYEFTARMLRDSAGAEGMRFFPLVFTLFLFILIANLFGMFPYFFTVNSHIIVTAAMAIGVFLLVVTYGIFRNGGRFFKLFVPSGLPFALLPVIVPIEVLSFLSRPLSHSMRLFANMLAGHITLKVFGGFVISLAGSAIFGVGAVSTVIGVLLAGTALAMTVALTALEFLVAALQAYVFAMLTAIYLNDALHPSGH